MRLKKKQKKLLVTWVIEGLMTDEINLRAANEKPSFKVSSRVVAYYRKTRKVDLNQILQSDENQALETGVIAGLKRTAQSELIDSLKADGLLRDKPIRKKHGACYVYLFEEEHGAIKIGVSANWKQRVRALDTAIPYQTRVIALIETQHARTIECELHERFASKRIRGEWFRLNSLDIEQILFDYRYEKVVNFHHET